MPTPAGLAFNVKAKSKARFAVAVAEPAIVLNADWQEWDDSYWSHQRVRALGPSD